MPIKNIIYKAFCTTPQRYYASISPKKKVLFCRSVAPSMFAYNIDSVCFHEIAATNISSPSTTTTTWRATTTSTGTTTTTASTTTGGSKKTVSSSSSCNNNHPFFISTSTRKFIFTFQTIYKTVIEYDTTTSLHTLYSLLRQQVKQIFLEEEYHLKRHLRQQYYRSKMKYHHHPSSLYDSSYRNINIISLFKKWYYSSPSSSSINKISTSSIKTRSSSLSNNKLFIIKNSNSNNNHNYRNGPKITRWIHTSSNHGQPMPHMPHPPSKDELLAQTRTFFERLKVRIKWPLMRQMRPWTLNDITALFSWLFLGHTVWLLVGTTSFVSLILWLANSLQFQGWVAYRIGQYLTSAIGATVVFESAIVPNWKDGKIRFNNVRIYRMPKSEREKFHRHAKLQNIEEEQENTAKLLFNHDDQSFQVSTQPPRPPNKEMTPYSINEDDPLYGVYLDEDEQENEVLKKWMWFDITLDRVECTFSLLRWIDGKGLVQSADVQGVRGVVDRRHVRWDPNAVYDPVAARHKYTPGDFELEKLTMEDLLVTVYQPKGFRPYPVSIFQAQLDRFRKQWLFYDLLCATSIVGAFDKCLFSVHSPQLEKSVLEQSRHIDDKQSGFRSHDIYHYYPFKKPDPNGVVVGGENTRFGVLTDRAMRKQGYKRKSRLRIDGVPIDHINRGVKGPAGWITSGTVDVNADIYIPQEASEADSTELLRQLVYELTDKIELPQPVTLGVGNGEEVLVVGGGKKNGTLTKNESFDNNKKFVMDVQFKFKDTKASVPLLSPDLTYVNNAMVRPVVAYINRNKTMVPIKCRVVMDLSNFDGAWSGYDSTLIDRMSEQLGKGFVDLTLDQQERNRRLKQIGFWSLREMTRNLVYIYDMVKGNASRGFWSHLYGNYF
ncbi:unnamed protein product [Cunninghamella blakesleeana]